MKADLLTDFRQAVDKAIAEGKSIQWFRKEFDTIVAKHGWEGWTGSESKAGRDWRTRVIYSTNLSVSYAAGRWQQLNDPDLLKSRPYWKYVHNDTVRYPRPLHESWSGLVLPANHPWFTTHFAPNGWGCRCRIVAVTAAEYKGHPPPDDGTYIYRSKDGVEHVLPKGIDYGWDYAPGANTDTSLRSMVQDKLIRYKPAISKALSRDINRYINAHEDIVGFAEKSLSQRSIEETLWLGFVENAEQIKQAVNEDVTGYLVLLSSQNIRHIELSREFDGKGQRPVVADDFKGVMAVLLNSDSIGPGDKSLMGNKTVKLWGDYGGEKFRLIFEILHGKKNRSLSLISMVIKTKK